QQLNIDNNAGTRLRIDRVKLWKDIQNAPEHYMAKLNQVLDPLLTSKDSPEQVKLIGMDTAISQMRKYGLIDVHMNFMALDDVIDMGRRLDAFTKSVKVGGAGKKPIIISIEKWIVKLIDGVGKSATTNLKNTTNGSEKGLKLRGLCISLREKGNILDVLKNLPQRNMQVIVVTDVRPRSIIEVKDCLKGRVLLWVNLDSYGRISYHQAQILKRLQGSAKYDRMNVKVPSSILIHDPNRTGKSSLMESCKNDGAAIVVIGTADNVKTLVKDIKDEFDMIVHLGKLDMVSRTKMVDGLMKDDVVLEDRDKICNYIASGASGMVWKNTPIFTDSSES
ncbi:hypothetical protein Tco_0807863, partial [Tanacetum coccineum]